MQDERRQDIRIDTALEAEYWAKGSSAGAGRGTVRDFSRGGLRFLFPKPVRKGETVDLTMTVPGDNVPVFATAEVMWAASERDRESTETGLKLLSIRPLDLSRLMDFVYSKWLGGRAASES